MRKLCLLFVIMVGFAASAFAQTQMEQADSLYALRGENFNEATLLADSSFINAAIDVYKEIQASATGPEKEEAAWKLMRAYYYKGRYTTNDSELKKKIFNLGKEIGEEALTEFPNSPGINLFSAIVWGVWAEEYGILAAARKGVAGKIKERCEKVIEIDPNFDDAGGYRVLGRVYFKSPKLWPILRWPSKSKAVKLLKKGLEGAPENLITKQFLAEALYSQDEKEAAVKLMNEVLATQGIVDGIAEDTITKNEVKAILKEWEMK